MTYDRIRRFVFKTNREVQCPLNFLTANKLKVNDEKTHLLVMSTRVVMTVSRVSSLSQDMTCLFRGMLSMEWTGFSMSKLREAMGAMAVPMMH